MFFAIGEKHCEAGSRPSDRKIARVVTESSPQHHIMNSYKGVIIEESLENKDVLKKVKIVSTKIEKVV